MTGRELDKICNDLRAYGPTPVFLSKSPVYHEIGSWPIDLLVGTSPIHIHLPIVSVNPHPFAIEKEFLSNLNFKNKFALKPEISYYTHE